MEKGGQIVSVFIIATLFIYLIYHFVNKSDVTKDIKENHLATIGHIVDIQVIGDHMTVYLTYEIMVNNISYKRDIGVSDDLPSICYPVVSEECKKKSFWVIYNPKDPNNSLIDLTEIKDTINQSLIIEDLDNFK